MVVTRLVEVYGEVANMMEMERQAETEFQQDFMRRVQEGAAQLDEPLNQLSASNYLFRADIPIALSLALPPIAEEPPAEEQKPTKRGHKKYQSQELRFALPEATSERAPETERRSTQSDDEITIASATKPEKVPSPRPVVPALSLNLLANSAGETTPKPRFGKRRPSVPDRPDGSGAAGDSARSPHASSPPRSPSISRAPSFYITPKKQLCQLAFNLGETVRIRMLF